MYLARWNTCPNAAGRRYSPRDGVKIFLRSDQCSFIVPLPDFPVKVALGKRFPLVLLHFDYAASFVYELARNIFVGLRCLEFDFLPEDSTKLGECLALFEHGPTRLLVSALSHLATGLASSLLRRRNEEGRRYLQADPSA